ncbi:hypothetical protein [Allokutzneria multivorans]
MSSGGTVPDRKPLHEDLPIEMAWIEGRRIYIRCAYDSDINQRLIAMNAEWHKERGLRYVGTVRKAKVLEVLSVEIEQRRARRETEQRAVGSGLRVLVPIGLPTSFHEQATRMGAVWDSGEHLYRVPNTETRTGLRALVDTVVAEREQREREQRQRESDARRARESATTEKAVRVLAHAVQQAAEQAVQRRERALAESPHPVTGEVEYVHEVVLERLTTAQAEDRGWPLDSVQQLPDSRRGVVLTRAVWFTNAERASGSDWHPDAPDTPHWNILYTLAILDTAENPDHQPT